MSTKNKESTRYYSDMHEKSVCNALNATQTPNSGATLFKKGDCVQTDASLLIECKTSMFEKSSVSIKKEWIDKNIKESKDMRLNNSCICFNFGPTKDNYYVISEKLMKYLTEYLIELNKEVE